MGQVVFARLGLIAQVLGYPVSTTGGRLLYLACDRPKQIARSLHRLATPDQRDELDARLVIWEGPPPADFAKHPSTLLQMCRAAEADTVVIDSLKDVAIGLTDDEVGAGLNRALQLAVANGVEVGALHHQRKGQGGAKPKTLEDVYGSTWITAGAGSVILLWGAAGSPLVELIHLKQPVTEVGPFKVEHDHLHGTTCIHRGFDVLTLLTHSAVPLTATEVARIMFESSVVKENDRLKAQRRLDRLVERRLAVKLPGTKGGEGGSQAAKYRAATLLEVA
jgi:replicative DNA helicase